MSTLDIKLSQSVVNKNREFDLEGEGAAATLGDTFAVMAALRSEIGSVTYYFDRLTESGNKYTFTFPGGIKQVMTANINPISQTGVATEYLTTIPGLVTETIKGHVNISYTIGGGDLTIYDLGGTVNAYQINLLQADPDFGKMSMGFTGNMQYDQNLNLSGTVSSLTLGAEKHFKEIRIDGLFNMGGNLESIAGGATPTMNGTLSRYNETYTDGSHITFIGNIAATANTALELSTFADPDNWTGNDTLNIDLPQTLYEDWVLNTGNGTDRVTLKGGGGRLFANTGADDDYVILADDAPVVDGGAGRNTLEILFSGGLGMPNITNFANLVLGGKAAINGTGDAQDNTITGNDGKNTLDGGGGTNMLIGGKGDDTYIVRDPRDILVETADGGKKDHVHAQTSYALADFIEMLSLTGSADIDATGNTLNNTITGNSGNNTLDGGGGINKLAGGLGNDVYVIQNTKDKITEKTDEGQDRIDTTLDTFSLSKFLTIEDLQYIGDGDARLTGNKSDNTLTGSRGDDTLDGSTGADAMFGGDGDDTYYIDNALDTVTELDGAGYDTILSTVSIALADYIEAVTLTGKAPSDATGNDLDNTITGNKYDNSLSGLDGNDILDGLGGNDFYSGGNGNDVFHISTALNAKKNIKTIDDFTGGEDSLHLNDTAFKWKGDLGVLLDQNFAATADGFATDTDQRIIYNTTTGALSYDADGSGRGKAVLFAVLNDAPDLLHTDITFV